MHLQPIHYLKRGAEAWEKGSRDIDDARDTTHVATPERGSRAAVVLESWSMRNGPADQERGPVCGRSSVWAAASEAVCGDAWSCAIGEFRAPHGRNSILERRVRPRETSCLVMVRVHSRLAGRSFVHGSCTHRAAWGAFQSRVGRDHPAQRIRAAVRLRASASRRHLLLSLGRLAFQGVFCQYLDFPSVPPTTLHRVSPFAVGRISQSARNVGGCIFHATGYGRIRKSAPRGKVLLPVNEDHSLPQMKPNLVERHLGGSAVHLGTGAGQLWLITELPPSQASPT